MNTNETNNFEITFSLDKDLILNHFLCLKQLETDFNNQFSIVNYTSKYKSLFVVVQCFSPENIYFVPQEKTIFRKKTNTLELYLILDYNQAILADESRLKSLFVQSISTSIQKNLKTNDFNNLLFINNLESLIR